jgi:hypothetical protein
MFYFIIYPNYKCGRIYQSEAAFLSERRSVYGSIRIRKFASNFVFPDFILTG